MTRRLIILCGCLMLIATSLCAQDGNKEAYTIFIDSVTNTPIYCVTVCDADGNYLGRSDVDGHIKLKKGSKYHVSHISYGSKDFTCDDATTIALAPKDHALPDVVVTARMKRYYHCKVFFRNVEYVDSCMKYYIEGVREFFIDTKNGKIKSGNEYCRRMQTTNKDITQKSRAFMIGITPGLAGMDRKSLYEEALMEKGMRIEGDIVYGGTKPLGRCVVSPEKYEVSFSCDHLYPKTNRSFSMFGYNQSLTEDKCTEVYCSDGEETPTVFDLKSATRCRHFTLSKKKAFNWNIDCEDQFFVVDREYTDTMEISTYEVMNQDFDRYRVMFPADAQLKGLLTGMDEVGHFTEF